MAAKAATATRVQIVFFMVDTLGRLFRPLHLLCKGRARPLNPLIMSLTNHNGKAGVHTDRKTYRHLAGYVLVHCVTLSPGRRGSATPAQDTIGPSRGERSIRKYALNDSRISCSIVLGVVGLIATAIVAYWPTWTALWRPHGYFVSFLALCLLCSARHRIASASIKPLPWALLILIPCSITAVLFWRSGIQALQLLMLPPLILLAVLAALGTAVTRAVAVPVAFLYFAVPAWNVVLTAPMQDLTIAVTRILTPVIGLPASFHGNLISFQNGITFEVTPGCSGASFLVQGLAVAMLLCELEQAPRGRRLRLLGSMALVALIGNWLRVLVILELGYSSGMRSTLATTHHVAFGYFLFVLVLAGYVWVATRQPSAEPAGETSALTDTPTWRPGGAYALVLVVLVSIPAFVAIVAPSGMRPALARDRGTTSVVQQAPPRSVGHESLGSQRERGRLRCKRNGPPSAPHRRPGRVLFCRLYSGCRQARR